MPIFKTIQCLPRLISVWVTVYNIASFAAQKSRQIERSPARAAGITNEIPHLWPGKNEQAGCLVNKNLMLPSAPP